MKLEDCSHHVEGSPFSHFSLQALLEGLRRSPESYYNMYYHSQMTYDFHAKDGKRRVARFRVIPASGQMEAGRLTADEQRELWYQL